MATWFGGVLFVAVAAPIIFRTVRESNPVLPTVLSVNLENQHGTLLAGSIVGNLLATLAFGPLEELTLTAIAVPYGDLATTGAGYGAVPYGVVAVSRGGTLIELRT